MKNTKEIVKNIFLFEGVNQAVSKINLEEAIHYKKGQDIYSEKNYRAAIGVVLDGKAQAVSVSGENTVLSVFSSGDVCGAAAVFSPEQSYISKITAVSDCTVLFISEQTLRELFKEYPQTAVNYINFLSKKIRFLNGKIALFTQNSVEVRLYNYLRKNGGAQKINMAALARNLGIGRTSLYRAVSSLEQQNLIIKCQNGIQLKGD